MLSRTACRRTASVGLLWAQPPAAARPLRPLLARCPLPLLPRRSFVQAPKKGDGPLMERRADRELPDVVKSRFRWSRSMPWFLLIVAGCSVAIFNYQKSSSPVVASTLYALRTSPRARALLGDEIYFAQRIPWIGGEMNQLRGRIDIAFPVKGTRATAVMRFASRRPTARGVFETLEWSLETADGRKIDLLEDSDGVDPFRGIQLLPDDYVDDMGLDTSHQGPAVHPSDEPPKDTRGFRQPTRR